MLMLSHLFQPLAFGLHFIDMAVVLSQGQIHQSIEWLDRTGMDIIAQVRKCASAAKHQTADERTRMHQLYAFDPLVRGRMRISVLSAAWTSPYFSSKVTWCHGVCDRMLSTFSTHPHI